MKKDNKFGINTILILIITVLVFYFVLKDNFHSVIDVVLNANYLLIILAVLVLFLHYLIRTFVFYKLLKAQDDNISFIETFKQFLMTMFFNAITPFSTGGQPLQIYMINKNTGLSMGRATAAVIQNSFLYQIALVACGLLAVIFNSIFNVFPKEALIAKLTIIGFIFHTLAAIFFFVLSFSSNLAKKLIGLFIKFLALIRIVKDKDKVLEKWDRNISEFSVAGKELRENLKMTFGGIMLNFLAMLLFYSIPFVVIKAIDPYSTITLTSALVATSYIYLIGAFVPIPGASGGIEYSFSKFYGYLLLDMPGVLGAALILWRFITYYLGMILGAIVTFFARKKEKI